jgi:hypothetical protein
MGFECLGGGGDKGRVLGDAKTTKRKHHGFREGTARGCESPLREGGGGEGWGGGGRVLNMCTG